MTIKATDFTSIVNTGKSLNSAKNINPEKAWQAAQKFEATFTSHVIQQMFAHNDTGLFGGGQTEVMFRSIWAEKIADSMPGMFGIAESVYPILLKGQEVNS
ncbi:MAG: rod-binding protein [Candidatus Paracaedibacteraceae bacterium]|nr:rod-binding protein [Candidatus Paracaedibacteraceae bacterium]